MNLTNLTSLNKFLNSALLQPWTAIYTKIIAIALIYGATVHICNILSVAGTPWLSTPLLWRVMDGLLLFFDIFTAIALWRGFSWSIWLLFAGITLLQILPYTLWRSHFVIKPEDTQAINSLLGTEIFCLSTLILLLWWKK
ncbi:MAG: hypothetical protein AAF298_17790 [Cyanobacteria bacterium P01_A01_bin.40]